MLSLFKYRFKCKLQNKSLLFWTLAFPFILTTLFASVLKGAYDPDEFQTIPIAVIDEAYYQEDTVLQETLKNAKSGETPLFDVMVVSDQEAMSLLKDKKVDGIIQDQTSIALHVRESDLNTTVISTFFSEYEQQSNMVKELLKSGHSLDEIHTLFTNTQNFIEENEKESNDLSAVFFYTVLAMVCMFGGQWSMVSMYDIQANQSSRAARLAMTPVHKAKYLLCDFMLCMMFEFVFLLLIYGYMDLVLDIAFGEHPLAILSTLLLGSLVGNAVGTLLGCATTKSIVFKNGILTAITMTGSFLAGMMMVQIKYFVQLYMPILNYINPVAMITDGLYCLYYYGIDERFYFNLYSMVVIIIVCYGISFLLIRKKRYHSLEAR